MKNRFGCGCALTVVALCAIVTILIVAAVYSLLGGAFTGLDTEPRPLPIPEVNDDTERAIGEADTMFRRIVDEHEGGKIALDSTTLNTWLRMSTRSELRFIAEHASFQIGGDILKAEISIPLAPIGIRGKFFNSDAALQGSLIDGETTLYLKELSRNGKSGLGWAYLGSIIQEINFAPYLKVEELIGGDLIRRCDIRVQDSLVKISCRPSSSP